MKFYSNHFPIIQKHNIKSKPQKNLLETLEINIFLRFKEPFVEKIKILKFLLMLLISGNVSK